MIMLIPTAPEVPAVKVVTLVYRHRRGRLTGDVIGQRVPMAHCTSGGLFRSATPSDYRGVCASDPGRSPMTANAPAVVMTLHSTDRVVRPRCAADAPS
jgi:hypothetical protein